MTKWRRYHRDVPISKLIMCFHEPLSAWRIGEHIARLREADAENKPRYLPPLVVTKNKNGTYGIKDGQHRFVAYLVCGWKRASCVVWEAVK